MIYDSRANPYIWADFLLGSSFFEKNFGVKDFFRNFDLKNLCKNEF